MSFGQANSEDLADSRGIVPPSAASQIRSLRVAEMWDRYDSIVIGPGASKKSKGWFDNWQDFANADKLVWFAGRDAAAGDAYTNQPSDRSDWAQDFYHSRIEFIAPPGLGDLETDSNDASTLPLLFSSLFPNALSFRMTMSDSDDILKVPGAHMPAGLGSTNQFFAGAANQSVVAGTNGEAVVSNCWKWPDPVMLAAKAKMTVTAKIDAPLRGLLQSIAGPGNKAVPKNDGSGEAYEMANWYVIRVSHWGPRYLQLRGARSSA